jgi:UrcA family protein
MAARVKPCRFSKSVLIFKKAHSVSRLRRAAGGNPLLWSSQPAGLRNIKRKKTMPTPRTLALAIVSSALIFIPSAFADGSKTQEVMIEVDLDAAPEATYESIRRQAWKVCKPETGTTYMSARKRVRRDCQNQIVTDVLRQLAQSSAVQFADIEPDTAH